MNAAPGGELRAAGGLWGPPARALREMLGRRFPKRHRPTWLSPGADQENSVLIRLLVAGWLTFRVAAPRLSPATTWGPSPANLVVANRPRGLTRDNTIASEVRTRATELPISTAITFSKEVGISSAQAAHQDWALLRSAEHATFTLLHSAMLLPDRNPQPLVYYADGELHVISIGLQPWLTTHPKAAPKTCQAQLP
jgi:hypothetical protein